MLLPASYGAGTTLREIRRRDLWGRRRSYAEIDPLLERSSTRRLAVWLTKDPARHSGNRDNKSANPVSISMYVVGETELVR
jgi:hypothetical protein